MTNVIDRYQDFRARRFLKNDLRYRRFLPGWRTRKHRRALIATIVVLFACMIAVGGICLVDMTIGPLLWLPAGGVFVVVWTLLQVVSSRPGDAPRDALDERELRERDAARSIGLTVTQTLTIIPGFLLIVAGSTGVESANLAYAAGLFVLTALIIGSSTPTLILAWTRTDPEPDDYLTEAAYQ